MKKSLSILLVALLVFLSSPTYSFAGEEVGNQKEGTTKSSVESGKKSELQINNEETSKTEQVNPSKDQETKQELDNDKTLEEKNKNIIEKEPPTKEELPEPETNENNVQDDVKKETEREPNQEQNNETESNLSNDAEINTPKNRNMEIQSFQIQATTAKIEENKTSRLGHIRSSNVKIFKNLGDSSSAFSAGDKNTNRVYYIKKQAKFNKNTYYLISLEPSSVNGVVGWVRASDLSTYPHVGVDRKARTFYIKGTGNAYTKAWGGSKDLVYNLSKYKNQVFHVHLTEKVGNNVWYRGTLDGKTVWIHNSYLTNVTSSTNVTESQTSRLGHIRSSSVKIFKNLGDSSSVFSAGDKNTNRVYYIKKQAKFNKDTYYLISLEPSSVNGVVGWVRASDLSTHPHIGVDRKARTFYIKGTGNAYTKAWGGSKDLVYNLSKYKNQVFHVHLTEKVGNNIWYRGTLNGRTVWIHNSYLTTAKPKLDITESKTSRLGHIRSTSVRIFKDTNLSSSFTAGSEYTNKVYYIKKQAVINGQTYYLISEQPSSVNGTVGWVKASDLSTHPHVGVDKSGKTFYIKGTGSAYSKAWGGSKDLVHKSMSQFANQEFTVNLTEKVGNNIWYRGSFKGKTIWLHSSYVQKTNTKHTNYNLTFNAALDRQMKTSPPPQTDKYRNQNAFIHKDYVDIIKAGAITGDGVRLRTTPKLIDNNNISVTVNRGTKVTILEEVTGDPHAGTTKWYKLNYNNQILYVHSSFANPNSKIATTNANVNIRESASTTSHIFATLKKGTNVNIIKEGSTWHEISYGAWRNAKSSDVEQYLNPNKNDQFQHLVLSGSANVKSSDLKNLLNNKGILHQKEATFIQASKTYNVNEVYLVAHALLETGHGTSALAKGVFVDKNGIPIRDKNGNLVLDKNKVPYDSVKVYNMFGIAAYDSNPLNGGAKKAYQEGWTTPEKAILGGAKWISENYINHGIYKQNTLYKMKWNPSSPGTHQYATDIGWATKQTARIKQIYQSVPNASLQYDIPKYK